jgi:hypothetical protein
MRDSVVAIDALLKDAQGKAVESLSVEKDEVLAAIDTFCEQLTDASTILREYIAEMTGTIAPIGWAHTTRTDSNDTYWNIQHMAAANEVRAYPVDYGEQKTDTLFYNIKKTNQINQEGQALTRQINSRIDELWRLQDVIAAYENVDDVYAGRVKMLYRRYTDAWECVLDAAGITTAAFTDLADGTFEGLCELVKGSFDLAGDVAVYAVADSVVRAGIYTGQKPPEFFSNYWKDANETLAALVSDPLLIAKGLGQEISDTVENRGLAFAIGALAPEVLGLKGLSRAGKLSRLGSTADRAGKRVDDIDTPKDRSAGEVELLRRLTPYPTLQRSGILNDKVFTNTTDKVVNYVSPKKGFAEAMRDFNRLPRGISKGYPDGAIVAYLPDGTTVNVRLTSSNDGPPTLEIHDSATKQSVKIRY